MSKTARTKVAVRDTAAAAPTREIARLEKNLMALGFFSPSKSRGKREIREKVIRVKREVDGRLVEAEAKIIPSVSYGLPTTADQDKYLAFQKIVQDIRRLQGGQITNPVPFQSNQLLSILGIGDAGNNFQDVYEWLKRMAATTIQSGGSVYLAKRRQYAIDIFHVFDRVVITGSEMPNGRAADRNFVWLSDWQLENINQNYLIPIDLETYRKLRNNIAKALVPLLQQWLYASRSEGRFEKRYEDLCELLDLRRQRYVSDIQKQLRPSLDELQEYGYISEWCVEPTNDGRDYKVVAHHGPKFFEDQVQVLPSRGSQNLIDNSPALLEALVGRGVSERVARALLRKLPASQPVLDQIEYVDSLVSSGRIDKNPPGFYVTFLRNNEPIPEGFESAARRQARETEQRDNDQQYFRRLALENAYLEYCHAEIDRHIERNLPPAEYDALLRARLAATAKQYPKAPPEVAAELARTAVRHEIRQALALDTLEAFQARQEQMKLFS